MNNGEGLAIAIVSSVSALGVAYIVNVQAKKVQQRKSERAPVDRMEQMFDSYDRLILQRDKEDERKARLMRELEEELRVTRNMVKKLEEALAISQRELEDSMEEVQELKDMLKEMRKEYKEHKDNERQ